MSKAIARLKAGTQSQFFTARNPADMPAAATKNVNYIDWSDGCLFRLLLANSR